MVLRYGQLEPVAHNSQIVSCRPCNFFSLSNLCWREIAAATALRYGQVESVAHGLFDVLNKHEHIPAVIADIAEFASHRNHDNRLVRPLRRRSHSRGDSTPQVTTTAGSLACRAPARLQTCAIVSKGNEWN